MKTGPARTAWSQVEPMAATRICFRYRPPGRHVSGFNVQIVLDDGGIARRIEIRRAFATTDDLPPLTRGRLSAARLRAAVDLLGLIERMIRTNKMTYAPGALVSVVHFQRLRHPSGKQQLSKPNASCSRLQTWATHNRTRRTRAESLAMALSRTTIILARTRIRYPVCRP